MKAILDRVFSKRDELPEHPHGPLVSSELTTNDLENYYIKIIADSLKRMLVTPDGVEIGVKRTASGPTGLPGFAGYVRILRWDPVLTPVLLQNIPVIEARVRKLVGASVILGNTHFAGLWFQAGEGTAGAPTALVGMPAELVRTPIASAPGAHPTGPGSSGRTPE